jgi:transposase
MRKMKRTVQQYSPELRAEAVRLVLDQGRTQGEAAQRLSVPKGTIANWVARAKHGRGPVSGAKTAQELESEIARLRKELAEVKQEREVLKKAAAYFAKESQQGTRS